jgi:hypothetical protein
MRKQLEKDEAALIRACEAVASHKASLDRMKRTPAIDPAWAKRKKAAMARVRGSLTKALRRACSCASDYQAEKGRNY